MQEIFQLSQLELIGKQLIAIFSSMQMSDVIDILIIAFLIYKVIELVQQSRAVQLLKGVTMVALLYFISNLLHLRTLLTLLRYVLTYGVFFLLVLFQPELRRVLEQLGRSNFMKVPFLNAVQETTEQKRQEILQTIDAICESCADFSRDRTGALIVWERENRLDDIIATGTVIDARAESALIGNIFFKNSPMHDGAMIIREGKVYACGCFLPLSQNYDISRMLGTRHRAALGMSEVSDAVVVVVSEETGGITVAKDGRLNLRLSRSDLKNILMEECAPAAPEKKSKQGISLFRRVRK